MKESFGVLPSGQEASLYTIRCGDLTAKISDYGATLVRLYLQQEGQAPVDVVLGFADANGYRQSTTYLGATVGRNANRIGKAKFTLNDRTYLLDTNDGQNNLHSGSTGYSYRLWELASWEEDAIAFTLHSPDGDQGFPGNADIRVTYRLEHPATLRIRYEGSCDRDTVFNLTNHTYFNMAGHDKPEKAMDQTLMMPARHFTVADAESIPTGELRSVEGTPMDFRIPKPVGRDIDADYEPLKLQKGYDHNFEVFANPCAVLTDPGSGRSVAISTDCCGLQFYSGNFLQGEEGKDGVSYCCRGGIALETQFYPDSVNQPQWAQPITRAGESYRSETVFRFHM